MVFTRNSFVKDNSFTADSKESEDGFTHNEKCKQSPSPRSKRQKLEENCSPNNEDQNVSIEVDPSRNFPLRRSSRQNKPILNLLDDAPSSDEFVEHKMNKRHTSDRLRQHNNRNNHAGAGVGKGGKHRSLEMVDSHANASHVEEEESQCHTRSTRYANNSSDLRDVSSCAETGDMYTRIKRMRRAASLRAAVQHSVAQPMKTTRRMNSDLKKSNDISKDVDEDETDEDDNNRRYPVRERRQAEVFSANRELYRPRRQEKWFNEPFSSPKKSRSHSFSRHRRKRRVSNSSTSSSSGSSGDEARFERRKAKSMQRSRNRFLPINFTSDDIKSGVLQAKNKAGGASLADVDPMIIDQSITFESVGGLTEQIQAMKEAVVLPLVYPEVFTHLDIEPPKGILFYGPPGTGKTLLARALSNECSKLGQPVAFFMRKGADCLSKWVGESERQLRLLFDQAFRMRPSIIFFDEIDGLAPVRSSKQDQIHASIVSTLLGLIDGLDQRGHVVVIGATNRLDSIDPALRRPGRFDREFYFPLPSEIVRADIMRQSMSSWKPAPPESLLEILAKKTQGFTGADLKALVREAGLCALRRRYPQIYSAKEKLLLKMSEIKPQEEDFVAALSVVRPSGQRSANTLSRALPPSFSCLLNDSLESLCQIIQRIFPFALHKSANPFSKFLPSSGSAKGPTEIELNNRVDDSSLTFRGEFESDMVASLTDSIHLRRPRLVVHGPGLSDHLMAAVLHNLDGVQIFPIDLPSLYSNSCSSVEECVTQMMINAQRASPSILFLPHLDRLLLHLPDSARHCVLALITQSLSNPTAQVLILATSSLISLNQTDDFPDWDQLSEVFLHHTFHLPHPDANSRRQYLSPLFTTLPLISPPSTRNHKRQKQLHKWHSEVLPVAPPPPPRKLSKEELRMVTKEEDAILRELRMSLRQLVASLARDQRFKVFLYPVDQEDVPDYYHIITRPMDLSQIKTNIDLHVYTGLSDFMKDIEQICLNALEYNPVTEIKSREIRHRACDLRDTAIALCESLVDEDLIKRSEKVLEARQIRVNDGQGDSVSYDLAGNKSILSQNRRDKATEKLVDYLAGPARQTFTPYHHKDQSRCSKRLMGESPVICSLKDVKKARKSGDLSIQEDIDSQMSEDKPDDVVTETKEETPAMRSPLPTRSQTRSLSPHLLKSPPANLNNGVDVDCEAVSRLKSPTKNSDSYRKSASPNFPSYERNVPKDNCSPSKPKTLPNLVNGDDSSTDVSKSNGNEELCLSEPSQSNRSPRRKKPDEEPNHLTNGGVDSQNNLTNKKEDAGTVLVNEEMLESRLNQCVAATNNWSVPQLEELYVSLACCLHHYRNCWDREGLICEYDSVFRKFFKN